MSISPSNKKKQTIDISNFDLALRSNSQDSFNFPSQIEKKLITVPVKSNDIRSNSK